MKKGLEYYYELLDRVNSRVMVEARPVYLKYQRDFIEAGKWAIDTTEDKVYFIMNVVSLAFLVLSEIAKYKLDRTNIIK